MAVVYKVEKLPGVSVHIQNDCCEIKSGLLRPVSIICILGESKIEATYKALLEFIEYYNKHHNDEIQS